MLTITMKNAVTEEDVVIECDNFTLTNSDGIFFLIVNGLAYEFIQDEHSFTITNN